jgi:hypothetical protein
MFQRRTCGPPWTIDQRHCRLKFGTPDITRFRIVDRRLLLARTA